LSPWDGGLASVTRSRAPTIREMSQPALRHCLMVTVLSGALLAGCALPPPVPGSSADSLRQAWGPPTDTHALPGGGQRLEYATGPFGRTTWMIDLDPQGRVQQARQVLQPAWLMAQPIGLDREALRREMGRPGEIRGVHGGGQTWYWRFETNDCLWLAASFSPAGVYMGGAVLPDPACDARSDGFD
jgi:hypothetical protein